MAEGVGSDVRLLVLCAGDPESARAFSGSARGLITALEDRGIVHHKANVLGLTDPFKRGGLPLRVLRRLDRLGLEEAYRWSSVGFGRNTRRAERIAADHPGFNACLMYGTTYCPRLNVPTYCYFDATVAQVRAAGGWEFGGFSTAKAQAIQDYQAQVFDQCTGIFPRTAWAARSVVEDYGVPAQKVVAAGAGPNHIADPLPHGPYDTQTILFIGTEFERKGGPLIVDAFKRIREHLPNAWLVIVGCSPEVDVPGVEVVGRIAKDAPGGLEKLLRLYSEASVFCIMSHFEPFGIVVLEAQNSYVPCVVPEAFAFTETVRDGETGRHVPAYDAATLAGVLTEMLSDPARLAEMGAAGHTYVRKEWTWAAAAARIEARVMRDLDR
jgi:glycosyltransferase involved in cell wall biosynthesis